MSNKPITVLDLAVHRGAKADEEGCFPASEFSRVGLPFLGGCELCGATVAPYNACPSKSGYLRCASECIGDTGWSDVAEADAAIFGPR